MTEKFNNWLDSWSIKQPHIRDGHRFYVLTAWESGWDHFSCGLVELNHLILHSISRPNHESYSVFVWDINRDEQAKLQIVVKD